jgi:glycosyltransferase involved in cell wall biosynthesis
VGSVLFGEKEYERDVHQLVQQLGLDDCIEFTGFREDVPDVIAGLDILVHASTTGEPFGQVIIEAMAAGKPVIATNGGGVPEIVDDGVTGLLVSMGDADAMAAAIERLLEDPALCARMGEAGLARVQQHFTIQLTAERVQAVYDQLIPKQKRESFSSTPTLSPQLL